jgi:uncharacterized protein YciI
MEYFALLYEVVDDFIDRRTAYRNEHLRIVDETHQRGELVLAGALSEPVGALLVFRADDRSVAEEFARNDPYVVNGLVTSWQVRPWAVVTGNEQSSARRGRGFA